MSPRALYKQLTRWLRPSRTYPVSILAVISNNSDRVALRHISARAHWQIHVASTFDSAIEMLRDQDFAVILCDRDLPGLDWREAIATLSAKAPRTSVILTSPVNNDYLWQEVIQCGGYDVLTKPFLEERVVKTITFARSKMRPTPGKLRNYPFANGVQN